MKTTNTYAFPAPYLRHLGYGVWGVLAIFSLVFYQERSIFLDNAFQLTDLINSGNFRIYHYRFTHVCTQVLPLFAIQLKLSLPLVMCAFSLNYILFFGGIYWLLVQRLQNDYLGWLLIFFFTLLSLDTFYVVTSEFYQGIALLLLLFAILLKYPKQESKILFLAVLFLIFCIVFAHKLTVVFFLLLWFFFLFHEKKLWDWKYFALFFTFWSVVFIHSRYFTNWYTAAKQKTFWNNYTSYFPDFHTLPANEVFAENVFKFYYFFPLFLSIVLFGYLFSFFQKNKNISFPLLKLVLVLGFCAAYLLLNHISDPLSSYRFYSEVNYLGLSIPVCLPLLFDFLPLIKNRKIVFILIVFISSIRLVTIANGHKKFKNRIEWFSQLLEKTPYQKSIIHSRECPKDIYIQEWASAEETLLISALKNPKKSKTLFITDKKIEEAGQIREFFLNANQEVKIEDMNAFYFQLNKNEGYEIASKKK